MIKIYDAATGTLLGDITDEQLQFLQDQFEEEWSGDQDYYLNEATLDMLREAGIDAQLLDLLKKALGSKGEADIRWSNE